MTDKNRIEFGRGVRSPHPQLLFKAAQAPPDVFGRLVLPGRPGGLGAKTRFGSWGQNDDGSYSGFVEDEGEPEPFFHLYVAGGEYTVDNAEDMREVIDGMAESKRRQEDKRLARQAEMKKIPQRVAEWREYVFSQMKHGNRKTFGAIGGSDNASQPAS